MAATQDQHFAELPLLSVIGFGGRAQHALNVHPSNEYIVYPVGTSVVVEQIGGNKKQMLLNGHTDTVTCVAVSPDGRYVASGQSTFTGFQAPIILWDFQSRKQIAKLQIHKTDVVSLAFSHDGVYLASVGGKDDGQLIVWDVEECKAVSSSSTSTKTAGSADVVVFSSANHDLLITGGNNHLRTWRLSAATRRLTPTDCALRSIRRTIKSLAVGASDEFVYCGTTSGDILEVALATSLFKAMGPAKPLANGVLSLQALANGTLVAGAGDGTVAVVNPSTWKVLKSAMLEGAVTSVALRGGGQEIYAGTAQSNVFRIAHADFAVEKRITSHTGRVNDIAFPVGAHEIYATCSINDIRVWVAASGKEALRITVPNEECLCIIFAPDGKLIYSGWSDGRVRAYLPQSGKLKFEIINAHSKGVTALGITRDGGRLLTGGGEGQVRSWSLGPQSQVLEVTLKEHCGSVTCIRVASGDREFVSASADGSCIVWNMATFTRSQIMQAKTSFLQASYTPDEAQLLTVGSDRKVAYWEVFDGALIRETEISAAGAVHGLAITADGEYFVTGGEDKLVKVWTYHEAEVYCVGKGHSGHVTKVSVAPGGAYILSGSADGAVFRWEYPE